MRFGGCIRSLSKAKEMKCKVRKAQQNNAKVIKGKQNKANQINLKGFAHAPTLGASGRSQRSMGFSRGQGSWMGFSCSKLACAGNVLRCVHDAMHDMKHHMCVMSAKQDRETEQVRHSRTVSGG